MRLDSIGLPMSDIHPLEAAVTIIMGGQAGSGKTTCLTTLPEDMDATLWILSTASILRAPAQLQLVNPEKAAEMNVRTPTNIMVLDELVPGSEQRASNKADLHTIFCKLASAARAGTLPYRTVVVSLWDQFLSRIYFEIKDTLKSQGSNDGFAIVNEVKAFHGWVRSVGRSNGFNLLLECNERPPRYQDDPKKLNYGKMLSKQGPNLPVYTMVEDIVNECDAYIRLLCDPTTQQRKWQLTESREAYAKLRGFSHPPFVPLPPGTKPEDLSGRDLLALAAYRL